MRYAVSDIHGKFDIFIKLLSKIRFSNNDILYVLGDVVDGVKENVQNPDDIKCLQYIIKTPNIKMIMGNHEYDLLEFLDDNYIYKLQKYSFTDKVKMFLEDMNNIDLIKNYLYSGFYRYIILPTEKLREIHIYLKKLPYYIIANEYILCHGGFEIPYDNISIEDVLKVQENYDIIWMREEFYNNKNRVKDKKIVFGHTPVNNINNKCKGIWFNQEEDKIGIDTSCLEESTLACINLDTLCETYCKDNE